MKFILIGLFMIAGQAFAQGPRGGDIEATSLLGAPLARPLLDHDFSAHHEALLAQARAGSEADPEDATALIWVGRQLGYLGRYRDAIDTLAQGAERFPGDARFLRHLGHRLITVRDFVGARAVLENAAALTSGAPDEIEPDGLPNDSGIPTSTLKGNIWYHLGLVRYLLGDFAAAAQAYETAAAIAGNPDAMAAARYWLYLSHARAGNGEAALTALEPVTPGLDLIENFTYYRLALSFKGLGGSDELLRQARAQGPASLATTGYGIAAQRLIEGDVDGARALLSEIVKTGAWPSFGYIAAEAELARAAR